MNILIAMLLGFVVAWFVFHFVKNLFKAIFFLAVVLFIVNYLVLPRIHVAPVFFGPEREWMLRLGLWKAR